MPTYSEFYDCTPENFDINDVNTASKSKPYSKLVEDDIGTKTEDDGEIF